MTNIICDVISLSLLFFLTLINNNIHSSPFVITLGVMAIIIESICLGIDYYNYNKNNNHTRIRGFEIVSEKNRKNKDVSIKLPHRATKSSVAYDFYAPKDYEVKPHEVVKVWTDVKAYFQDNECLMLNVRSSMGGRFMLANTQGWVESDYYDCEANEGNIGLFLLNLTDEVLQIKQGEAIGQGMFVKYLTVDNDNTTEIRKGGFGSTNKN